MAFNRGARGLLPQAHDLEFRGLPPSLRSSLLLSASRSNLENLPSPAIEKVHGSQIEPSQAFPPRPLFVTFTSMENVEIAINNVFSAN